VDIFKGRIDIASARVHHRYCIKRLGVVVITVLCRTRVVVVFACALIVTSASPAYAAPGDLDTSFGGDGKVITNFTRRFDAAAAVAIQADGKIVTAGGAGFSNTKFALARYNTDGTLDTTFGGDGRVTTNFTAVEDSASGVAIEADGKIVAAGGTAGRGGRFALARYNTDGTLDTTFGGGDGKVITNFTSEFDAAHAVAIQADGNVVAGGEAAGRFALARYNTDGTLDTTFGGGDGKVTTNFTARYDAARGVAIQAEGKIVAAGGAANFQRFALARYNTDGTLDTSFGGDGKVTTNFTAREDAAADVVVRPNGKIIATGGSGGGEGEDVFNTRFALARYNPDGDLDTSFGGDGKVTTNFTAREDDASGVAVQANGKIVTAGRAGGLRGETKFALARYNANGTLDTTFGGDGKVTTNITAYRDGANGVAIQSDGKIVAAGGAGGRGGRFALARYLGV
jgi:uncharacterized delta-60 repeat protein